MPDLHFEKLHGLDDGKVICGVDEVGRGPLAGPVIAAALILPQGGLPPEIESHIRDSKKMSARQRENLFPALTDLCRYAVAEASVAEIDTLNIFQASLLAMLRAVTALGERLEHKTLSTVQPLAPLSSVRRRGRENLDLRSKSLVFPGEVAPGRVTSQRTTLDLALIDGKHAPVLPCPAVTIIQGDNKSLSIAAASIIAKVTRDRFMKQLAEQHPGYGWEKNAGYGTAQHLKALQALGPTKWHRTSFAPVANYSMVYRD